MFDLNTSVCLKRHMLRLLHLKVDKRLGFAIEYVILKQNTTYFKNIYFRIKLKQGINIYIYLQAYKICYWVNDWRFIIYSECWTISITFQTKMIYFSCMLILERTKKEEISADAALNLLILTMYVISRYEYC